MGDIITALQTTPVPTILVVGGMAFLFLAVVGQFAGEIKVSGERQVTAAVIGVLLLFSGVALYIVPVSPAVSTPTIVTRTPPAPPTSTPAVTNTPTQTETPTPTPTPLLKGELLFEDDFDDNRYGWETSSMFWFEDGWFHARMLPEESEESWCLGCPYFQDFILEAVVTRIEHSAQSGYRLFFRGVGDGTRFYAFGLHAWSGYDLTRVDRTVTPERWDGLLWGDSRLIDRQSSTHKLTIVAQKDQLRFYVDERLVDEFYDADYSEGAIGFNLYDDIHIALDYVRVWALPQ